ncbi:MAG TPA: SRPBCC domain-containing protein [Hyphomonadaceae bacterium]|nr:SRPBCC domain-containing protein [Hyphomonadaceae bacterium]
MNAGKLSPIVGETTLNVPLKRAWSVLTEPGYVVRWLGCMNYANEIGRVFYMQQDGAKRAAGDVSGATHCEVLALDEPNTFRFSWFMPGTPTTEVEIRLAEVGPKETRVTLTHSGWDKFNAADVRMIWEALSGGWISYVLPGFKKTAEAG